MKKSKPLEPAQIACLARLAADNGILELEWGEGKHRVMLKLTPTLRRAGRHASIIREKARLDVTAAKATNAGEFYPVADRPISVGDAVCRGQMLAFVRTGPLLRPLRAPCNGMIISGECVEGDNVIPGDILFKIISSGN